MKKKDLTFIIGISILAAVIWIVGELIMMKLHFPRHFYIIWRVFIVTATCAVSVRHAFSEEIQEKSDATEKFNRKSHRK
ncbi:MAG: hypothetical protein LKG21_02200 [Ruminococcus sp.]|jgi:Na+/citrate or Na+/malate symporter|nr:hypothetical protein [Ruminococcus sp.]